MMSSKNAMTDESKRAPVTPQTLNTIAQIIFDKKGTNILALDVRGLSCLTDYVIIAEGAVNRHVCAIAEAVQKGMKEKGEKVLYFEGMKEGDWVVLDFGHVMVHIFDPQTREKYQLEQLWQKADIVDLKIEVGKING